VLDEDAEGSFVGGGDVGPGAGGVDGCCLVVERVVFAAEGGGCLGSRGEEVVRWLLLLGWGCRSGEEGFLSGADDLPG
jgi:hypothetical protein